MELIIVNYKYDVGDLIELSRFFDSAYALIIRRDIEYVPFVYDALKHMKGTDIVINKMVGDLLSYDICMSTGALMKIKERDILKKVDKDVI